MEGDRFKNKYSLQELRIASGTEEWDSGNKYTEQNCVYMHIYLHIYMNIYMGKYLHPDAVVASVFWNARKFFLPVPSPLSFWSIPT